MPASDHHAERLLLAIVRGDWETCERLVAATPIDDGAAFAELCRLSDVHPWVHSQLTSAGRTDLLPSCAIERLRELHGKVSHDNLLLMARTEQALDTLNDRGVIPMALKGFDSLHRLYDRFDQRTIDDVDLLVRSDDLTCALAALEEAGWTLPPEPKRTHYIRSSHHIMLDGPGPIPVMLELHWNLAQRVRFSIDVAGLFERAAPLSISGRDVLRMDDHDAVAHLLLHHFTHYFDRRLKWLVDLRALGCQPGFDWNRVAERVRGWGATAAVGFSVQHIDRVWPGLIPASAVRSMRPSLWRRAVLAPLRSSHPLELFRGTRNRRVQLILAAAMLEDPTALPGWLWHRTQRDEQRSENPLDTD